VGEYTEHAPSQASEIDGLPDENGSLGEQCCCDDCGSAFAETRIISGSTTACTDSLDGSVGIGLRWGGGAFDDGSEEGEAVTFTFPSGKYDFTDGADSRTKIFIAWDQWLVDMWTDCRAVSWPIRLDTDGDLIMYKVGSYAKYFGTSPVSVTPTTGDGPDYGYLYIRFSCQLRKSGTSTTESYILAEVNDSTSGTWYKIFEDTFPMPSCGETAPISGPRVMYSGKNELTPTPETEVDVDSYSELAEAISAMFSGGMFVLHPCAVDAVQDHKVDPFGVFTEPTHTDLDLTVECEVLPNPCYEWLGVDKLKIADASGSTVTTKSQALRVPGANSSVSIILDSHSITATYYASAGCTGSTTTDSTSHVFGLEINQACASVYTGNDLGGVVGVKDYTPSFDCKGEFRTDLETVENMNLSINVGTS